MTSERHDTTPRGKKREAPLGELFYLCLHLRNASKSWIKLSWNSSLGTGSAVGEKGKKRGQIGKISAKEASRGVTWGRGKGGATLFPPQTTSRLADPLADKSNNEHLPSSRSYDNHSIVKSACANFAARLRGSFHSPTYG